MNIQLPDDLSKALKQHAKDISGNWHIITPEQAALDILKYFLVNQELLKVKS